MRVGEKKAENRVKVAIKRNFGAKFWIKINKIWTNTTIQFCRLIHLNIYGNILNKGRK